MLATMLGEKYVELPVDHLIKEEPIEESVIAEASAQDTSQIFVDSILPLPEVDVKDETAELDAEAKVEVMEEEYLEDEDFFDDKPETYDDNSDVDPNWNMDDGGNVSDASSTAPVTKTQSLGSKRSPSVKLETPDANLPAVKLEEKAEDPPVFIPPSKPVVTPSGKPPAKPFKESKDGKVVYCPECNKSFTDKFVLQRHGDILHPEFDWHMRSITWRCRFCDSEFRTTRMKKAHEALCQKAAKLTPVLQEEIRRKTLPYTKTGKPKAPAMLIDQKSSSVFCPICLMKFKSKWNAQKHGQQLHEEYDWFFRPPKLSRNCKYCGKTFCKAAMREDHELKCGGENSPYECDHCDFKSFYRGSIRDHMLKHRQYPDDEISSHLKYLNRPGVFPCEICGEISNTKRAAYNHKSKHKKQNRRLEELQKASESDPVALEKLEKYLKKLDSNRLKSDAIYPYRCDICIDSAFKSEEGLKAHLELHNPSQKKLESMPFACNLCEQRFGLEKMLESHLRNHEKGLVECCQTCGRTLKKDQMSKHQMIHNGEKPFMCEVCGKKFIYKHAVTDHMKVHSVPGGELECEKCGLKTTRRQIMSLHSKRCKYKYKGSDPVYRCSYCGMEFDKLSGRSKHIRNEHVGFRCVRCSVQFNCYSHLKQHRKTYEHKQMKLVKKGLITMEEFKQERDEVAAYEIASTEGRTVRIQVISE